VVESKVGSSYQGGCNSMDKVCRLCGVQTPDVRTYSLPGPIETVEGGGLEPIGFTVVPVAELCEICAALVGVADEEILSRVREYVDLMKVSVEGEGGVGYVGPSSHPVPPEPLHDILFGRDEELQARSDQLIPPPGRVGRVVEEAPLVPEEEELPVEEEEELSVGEEELPEDVEEGLRRLVRRLVRRMI